LLDYLKDKPVNPVVIEDDGVGLFNRSKLLNRGISESDADIVWLADSDILIDKLAFERAGDLVLKHNIYKPFRRRIYDVPLETYREISQGGRAMTEESSLRIGLGVFSGVIAAKRSVMFQIGGFDEAFCGWGGEDYAIARLAYVLGFSWYVDDLPAYHFAHERLPVDTPEHEHFRTNRELWLWYDNASKQQLRLRAKENLKKSCLSQRLKKI